MPGNDLILLDSLARKSYERYGSNIDESEAFELFVCDSILKSYDLSFEELHEGWVDGPDDGGIDGFFTFVDGIPLTDDFESKHVRRDVLVQVYLISVKTAENFRQAPLNSLIDTVKDLFDLGNDFENKYNEKVLSARERFRSLYLDLADRTPSLAFSVLFCTRGDAEKAAPNVKTKCQRIEAAFANLFSRCHIEAKLLGSSELLRLAQKVKRYSLRLPFTDAYISREGLNYVTLCRLADYLRFITDEEGNLRRYLFEGNVRDYLGDVQVNNNIAQSLLEESAVDFWWLNNGITILVSSATIAAKTLQLENVLIVNGLQTTETIYRTLHSNIRHNDERAILVKIVNNADDDVRSRIIKATNYQNSVDLASLRSLDPIQINIEQFLLDHDWFYERRHNYYRNQGKPADRIFSIKQLGAAVRAVAFRTPRTAERRQKWIRDDNSYFAVFNEKWPLDLFLVCVRLVRIVDNTLRKKSFRKSIHGVPSFIFKRWGSFVACLLAMQALKNERYEPADLPSLKDIHIDEEIIANAVGHIISMKVAKGSTLHAAISQQDEADMFQTLASESFTFLRPPNDVPGIIGLSKKAVRELAKQEAKS